MPQSLPKLSILSSYGYNEKWETCLAAAFSPKEGTLSLSLENKKSVNHTVDKAVMSKDGTYYFAAFSEDAIETCQMKGKSVNKDPGKCKYTSFLDCFFSCYVNEAINLK